MSYKSGSVFYIECKGESSLNATQLSQLKVIFSTCTIVGFNSTFFDLPIVNALLCGNSTSELSNIANAIINEGWRNTAIYKAWGVTEHLKSYSEKHIDIMNVAPSKASLKLYACRLHVDKVQDLPYSPDSELTNDKMLVVLWYCINDLRSTVALYGSLQKELDLRSQLSQQYKKQMLSRSDAQVAEDIIGNEIYRITNKRNKVPDYEIGEQLWYEPPSWLKFRTKMMQNVLHDIQNEPFVVNPYGKVHATEPLKIKVKLGNTEYKLGIGGLHSCEKSLQCVSDTKQTIMAADVVSYYPFIILNMQLYPQHLGKAFLNVYKNIVERRLKAKASGDHKTSASLKIAINGTFGKLASPYSILYSVDLMLTVTVTGQLTLLMLIEALELAGIEVVSANTDGLVAVVRNEQKDTYNHIVNAWQKDTGFKLEFEKYNTYNARDVNNYIAVQTDKAIYGKGIFGNNPLMINPANNICNIAITEYLVNGQPIEVTIYNHKDIRDFVSIRTVKGGAVYKEQYLGKAIRWYMAQDSEDSIVYVLSGNKVPKTDGAKPAMVLPDKLPSDIDYQWYISETFKLLEAIGCPV